MDPIDDVDADMLSRVFHVFKRSVQGAKATHYGENETYCREKET
jgi:hypothetical protein